VDAVRVDAELLDGAREHLVGDVERVRGEAGTGRGNADDDAAARQDVVELATAEQGRERIGAMKGLFAKVYRTSRRFAAASRITVATSAGNDCALGSRKPTIDYDNLGP
jgi:hypothetical protein